MFLAKIRFLLVIVFFIIGIALHVYEGIGVAWFAYVAAFILLLTHFMFGNVSAAFLALQKGKLADAEELIDRIKKPEWLSKQHRAYYYFVKGMIAQQHKDVSSATTNLKEALAIGMRTQKEEVLILINLLHYAMEAEDKKTARAYLTKIKAIPTDDLLIKERVSQFEQALA